MLVFPGWRADLEGACRRPQWAPHAGLAAYVAPPHQPVLPSQIEDEYSLSSCSSPEHGLEAWEGGASERECQCEWEGCGAAARGVAALSTHVARAHAHPRHDGLFYCAWRNCSRPHRGFNARYKMLVHVRTHTNERPHACAACGKCFSRAENLKIHLRSHSGEKPYACPFEGCNKAYSNSSDRFKHTRTHAVDKPYSCKVIGCEKRYTDPSSLRKHVKTYKHYTTPPTTSPERRDAITERNNYVRAPPTFETVPSNYGKIPPTYESTPATREKAAPTYEMVLPSYERVPPTYQKAAPTYERVPPTCGYEYRPSVKNTVIYPAATEARYGEYEMIVHEDFYEAPETMEEAPLDLKCRREHLGGVRVRGIEESMEFQLVTAMEMPLDLSTKS